MSSSVGAFLGLFAAFISIGIGLLYGIAGTLLYAGFRGEFEYDDPLWSIVLIIVMLFGSAASGGFAGGAVAWAALRKGELTRVARRGAWAFIGVTIFMWVYGVASAAVVGLFIPLLVYTAAALALILVVARRGYRQ